MRHHPTPPVAGLPASCPTASHVTSSAVRLRGGVTSTAQTVERGRAGRRTPAGRARAASRAAGTDDAERERMRPRFREPYRTLLGHFRHESGHYFRDRLVRGSDRLQPFRKLCGDETADYG